MTNDYFGIFAGGGVRGTAYVGVLKALESLNIKLSGIAGSSAGAMIASLIGAGYNYSEIKELLFKINYQTFKDLYIPLGKDFGFFKGDEAYTWLKKNIEKKYYGVEYCNNCPPVTFKDIDKDIVIIATDVTKSEFKEFSKVKTPDVELAHATRASISIPGFFKPVWENNTCIVDGDVINNFPLWRTTSDIIANRNSKILDFRLEGSSKHNEIENFFDYFNAIIDTNYSISTQILEREFGENHQFEVIRINTGSAKIIDFNITNEKKEELVEKGYYSTRKYFEYNFYQKNDKIEQIHQKIKKELKCFKNSILKNNPVAGALCIGNLSILFAENKKYLHKLIYKRYLEIQSSFQNNMLTIKFLNLSFLRDRKAIIDKIDRIIKDIDSLKL